MNRPTTGRHILAGVLIAAFFLQSFFASRIHSPTSDEPPHLTAGLSYVEKGNFRPNPQHPPLLKELAGASLLLAGIHLPDDALTRKMYDEAPGEQVEWLVGNGLIAQNGPARVMLWARLPIILLSTLLALLIYVWGRQLAGDLAALGALFLFALDPTLVAHSAFVTTDMGLAVFGTLFYFALWRDLRSPSPGGLVLTGLAMGLALCAKFSAAFLIAPAIVLVLASKTRGFGGVGRGEQVARRVLQLLIALLVMGAAAAVVIMAIYRSPAGLAMYRDGLGTVYADHRSDYLYYMAGRTQPWFLSYFAVAWLLKEPMAVVALVLFGTVTLVRNRTMDLLEKLFILLPPAALFAACTFAAHDIGIRYIIPALPFACLAGGAALGYLADSRSRAAHVLAGVLAIWIVVAAAGIYPDDLSYFNEAACLLREPAKMGLDGGTRCGPLWLDDSNVDWGQGLGQLTAWLREHPDPRVPRVAYFGSFPPEDYGITGQPAGIGEFDEVAPAGLYVISSHLVARYRESWLRTIPPRAIVGHAYYIYDISHLQTR